MKLAIECRKNSNKIQINRPCFFSTLCSVQYSTGSISSRIHHWTCVLHELNGTSRHTHTNYEIQFIRIFIAIFTDFNFRSISTKFHIRIQSSFLIILFCILAILSWLLLTQHTPSLGKFTTCTDFSRFFTTPIFISLDFIANFQKIQLLTVDFQFNQINWFDDLRSISE